VVVLALLAVAAVPAAAQPPPSPGPPSFDDDPDPAIVDGSAQRRLDAARRRWRRADIHNYRFAIERSCFCVQRGLMVLFVRGDRPISPPSTFRSVATVRRLQRAVQRAIDAEVHDLSVRYDRRGVPRSIGIDRFGRAADDEVAYRVTRFWRGTRGRGGPDVPEPGPRPAPVPR
jgi:hypothetical protein